METNLRPEDDNPILRTWTPEGVKLEKKEGALSHHEILVGFSSPELRNTANSQKYKLSGYNPDGGVKIAGHRGYALTGPGVRLNQALINFGLDFLAERGYTECQPPYFSQSNRH